MRRSALGAGEVATQLSQLVLELLDTPPQVFHDDVPRLRTSVTVAHHGLQPGQHDVRLADPAAQALVVRRASGRDLEAALDDAPLLEPSSPAQHVIR
jgi:hypothetical protein